GGIIISFFAGGGHLFNYRLVYVAAFLSAVPVLIFAFLYHDVPGTERSTVEQKDLQPFFSAFKNFFSHPLLVAIGGIEMAAYFCFGVIETYLPVHLIKNGISAGSIGVLFSLQVVSIALSKPFFGTMADHHDKRPHILLGLLVVGITTGIMAAVPSVVWLAVANMIFGLGFSLCTVSSSTYVAEIADRDQLGSSMGALSSIMDIGHSSGPLITGFIVMYTSISFGCVCSSVLAFLAVLYFFVYTHRKASSKFS
ncbi:MAG: MFS transporter, partial [Endomicrobiales bacterium]